MDAESRRIFVAKLDEVKPLLEALQQDTAPARAAELRQLLVLPTPITKSALALLMARFERAMADSFRKSATETSDPRVEAERAEAAARAEENADYYLTVAVTEREKS